MQVPFTNAPDPLLHQLPLRVRNKLIAHGITSGAGLIAYAQAPTPIKQLGPEAMKQIFEIANSVLRGLLDGDVPTEAMRRILETADAQFGPQAMKQILNLADKQFDPDATQQTLDLVSIAAEHEEPLAANLRVLLRAHMRIIQEELASNRLDEGLSLPLAGEHVRLAEFCARSERVDDTSNEQLVPLVQCAAIIAESLALRSIDAELHDLFAQITERDLFVLRSRCHPFRRRTTLEQCGLRLGLTRERVRQIERRAERRLTEGCANTPLLRIRTAVQFMKRWIVAGMDWPEMEHQLVERGLLSRSAARFRRNRRAFACGFLPMQRDFTCRYPVQNQLRTYLVDSQMYDDLLIVWSVAGLAPFPDPVIFAAKKGLSAQQMRVQEEIHRTAMTLNRNCGAVCPAWLSANAQEADVCAALRSLGYDEIVSGWYRKAFPSRDVIENVARKVFSVTEAVTAREFRFSLMKHLARRSFPAPPTPVVAQVGARLDFITFTNGLLRRTSPLNPEEELQGSERVLFRYLEAYGPIVNYQEMFEHMRDEGFSNITLAVRLKQSPVIRKVKYGLYALVGTDYTASDIADAEMRVSSVASHTALRYRDGTAILSLNAGAWLVCGGAVNASSLAAFAGDWTTLDETRVRVRGQSMWGLDAIFDRLNVRIGDRISIVFSPKQRKVSGRRAESDE